MNQYSPVRASCAARFARSSTHEMARNQRRSMFVRYKLAATGKKLKLREGIVLLIARGHYILLLSFPIIAVDLIHIYVGAKKKPWSPYQTLCKHMITTEFLSYAIHIHAILPYLALVRRNRICYPFSGLTWLYEFSHGKVIQSDCMVGFRRYWGVRISYSEKRGKAKEMRRVKMKRRFLHPVCVYYQHVEAYSMEYMPASGSLTTL